MDRMRMSLRMGLRRVLGPRRLRWRGFAAYVAGVGRRKRLSSGETRVYYSYRATVPRHVAEELGLDPEGDLVLILASRPRWYHLLNYNEEENLATWRSLPEWARGETCLAGRGPRSECRDYGFVVVVAKRAELERLGLEPGTTVTLAELQQRTNAGGAGEQ